MAPIIFDYTVTERFLRYVTIDTQSDPNSPTTPSTEKQKDLGRLLAGELREIGLADAALDPRHAQIHPARFQRKRPEG